MKVDNAVIMAAGASSRFAPLSYEIPKALIEVKGEILIERQIRQLLMAGIPEVFVITGYKADQFKYLSTKYPVSIVYNPDYSLRNNNSSIWAVRDYLKNSYVCSADNYFVANPFESVVDESYYSVVYAEGHTDEWCVEVDSDNFIQSVSIGGYDSWYMLGHTFWTEEFSRTFCKILDREYWLPETAGKLWEQIFLEHTDMLKMKIQKNRSDMIYEFDTLDELRVFDNSYVENTRSNILKKISQELDVFEKDLVEINAIKGEESEAVGFSFNCCGKKYLYYYEQGLQ